MRIGRGFVVERARLPLCFLERSQARDRFSKDPFVPSQDFALRVHIVPGLLGEELIARDEDLAVGHHAPDRSDFDLPPDDGIVYLDDSSNDLSFVGRAARTDEGKQHDRGDDSEDGHDDQELDEREPTGVLVFHR